MDSVNFTCKQFTNNCAENKLLKKMAFSSLQLSLEVVRSSEGDKQCLGKSQKRFE